MFKVVKWLLITLVVAVLLVVTLFSIAEISKPIDSNVVEITNRIDKRVALVSLAQRMEFYDEVLTQSARNYAFTGEVKWKDRYFLFEHRLDSVVQAAIRISSRDSISNFSQLDTANMVLVEMEHGAIANMDSGEQDSALSILESPRYEQYKKLYLALIGNYLTGTILAYEDIIHASDTTLSNIGPRTRSKLEFNLWIVIAGLAIIIGLITAASIGFTRNMKVITNGLNVLLGDPDQADPALRTEPEITRQLETIQQKIVFQRESAVQSALSTHNNNLRRNLHDSMGVILSTLKLQLHTLNPQLTSFYAGSTLQKDYDQCIYLVNKAYNEMRALSSPEQQVAGVDLSWLINSLVSQTETVYPCKITFDNNLTKEREKQLDEGFKRDIYLLLSETVNNIIKHSESKNIFLRLHAKLDSLVIVVKDDGKGFTYCPDKCYRGNGLRNLKERVNGWSGQLFIHSVNSKGTIVKMELPVPAKRHIVKS